MKAHQTVRIGDKDSSVSLNGNGSDGFGRGLKEGIRKERHHAKDDVERIPAARDITGDAQDGALDTGGGGSAAHGEGGARAWGERRGGQRNHRERGGVGTFRGDRKPVEGGTTGISHRKDEITAVP
jgi:hypothetical protein